MMSLCIVWTVECRILQWVGISCSSDWGNKTYIQKFARVIVDVGLLGRLKSRWKSNLWLHLKEVDWRWKRLAMVMSTGGFWYFVKYSVSLSQPKFSLHIMFSKIKIKCNNEWISENECNFKLKDTVVWLVF
jgi:hypothetical protein